MCELFACACVRLRASASLAVCLLVFACAILLVCAFVNCVCSFACLHVS